jgi:hypothetical protein
MKLEKLVEAAGINEIDFKKKLVAIKLHFGEPGNLGFIRPNYIAPISKIILEKEGLPFLTDANPVIIKENCTDAEVVNKIAPMKQFMLIQKILLKLIMKNVWVAASALPFASIILPRQQEIQCMCRKRLWSMHMQFLKTKLPFTSIL